MEVTPRQSSCSLRQPAEAEAVCASAAGSLPAPRCNGHVTLLVSVWPQAWASGMNSDGGFHANRGLSNHEGNSAMRNTVALALGLTLTVLARPAHAEETAATSRIVAVGLFKNGLAVVKREATVGGPGTYVLDDVPEPVHGTFWIECSAPIETSVQMREVDVPAEQTVLGNPQEDLAGKKVTIHFKGDKLPPANGTVMK